MSIEVVKAALPDYAKDLRLNLGSLMNETILTDEQKYGCLLASAYAVGQPDIVRAALSEVDGRLSEQAQKAAKAAAAIMSMNNVYYRAAHLLSNEVYQTLPAKLRMNVIASPGIDRANFELYSLAVSAINGCGMCLDAHEAELRKSGMTSEQIQAALRIAALVNAVSRVLAAEEAAESHAGGMTE